MKPLCTIHIKYHAANRVTALKLRVEKRFKFVIIAVARRRSNSRLLFLSDHRFTILVRIYRSTNPASSRDRRNILTYVHRALLTYVHLLFVVNILSCTTQGFIELTRAHQYCYAIVYASRSRLQAIDDKLVFGR